MKKIFSLLFLLVVGVSAFAQKSYVTVYCSQNESYTIRLSGAIPSTMKAEYKPYNDFGKNYGYFCIGDVLNLLADNGFTVEQMNTIYTGSVMYSTYLLSKSSSSSASKIATVTTDSSEEVTEVARYNLQGIPVTEADKGVQIIVYSNYTTKTVILQ